MLFPRIFHNIELSVIFLFCTRPVSDVRMEGPMHQQAPASSNMMPDDQQRRGVNVGSAQDDGEIKQRIASEIGAGSGDLSSQIVRQPQNQNLSAVNCTDETAMLRAEINKWRSRIEKCANNDKTKERQIDSLRTKIYKIEVLAGCKQDLEIAINC